MQRPTSVTVFGVLNLVFAVLGGVGLVASIGLFLLPADTNNPVVQLLHDNPAYATWLKICIPLGVLSCAVLLAAGIGLLCLKSWGRVLSIVHAGYSIVFGVVGMAVNFVYLMQPMLEQAREKHGPEAAAAIGGAIGGSIGSCFGMAYPIILLIFMLRPSMAAIFHPPANLPAS